MSCLCDVLRALTSTRAHRIQDVNASSAAYTDITVLIEELFTTHRELVVCCFVLSADTSNDVDVR